MYRLISLALCTVHMSSRQTFGQICPPRMTVHLYFFQIEEHTGPEYQVPTQKGKRGRKPIFRFDRAKDLTCKNCNKLFTSGRGLRLHEARIHQGKYPYYCPICQQGFSSPDNLRGHLSTAHNYERAYKCSVCDKRFSTKTILRKHTVRIHPETLSHDNIM